MLLLLAAGLSLWMIYGFMRGDIVIIIANGVSLTLLVGIIYFKLREKKSASHRADARKHAA